MGGFNEIMFQDKKKGIRPHCETLMSNFRKTIVNCGFFDLGHRGDFFTWNNRHKDDTFMKEILDWALATVEWSAYYNVAQVESVALKNSNHQTLLATYSNYDFLSRKN